MLESTHVTSLELSGIRDHFKGMLADMGIAPWVLPRMLCESVTASWSGSRTDWHGQRHLQP